jgi:CRP/FNR family cyclic AMP-dependent transcriptional regulator
MVSAPQHPAAGSFVASLDRADRIALLDALRTRQFAVGDTLFHEGGTDAQIAVILAGRVKLEAHAQSGRRVLLGVRGPGELLGELRAFDGLTRGAQVRPLEPVTAGVMPIPEFRALIAERPEIALAMLRTLAGRLREADRVRLELGTGDAVARVCGCLAELARLYGRSDGHRVELHSPLTQQELGDWAGLSRPATTRALRQLRDDGLVSNRGRRFELHDRLELERRAGR